MKKKKAIIIFLVLCFGVVSLLVDPMYYVYSYYRILNGNSFPPLDERLAAGFFIRAKDESKGEYIVYHRDLNDVPLIINAKQKANFSEFLKKGFVSMIHDIDGCKVYRDTNHSEEIYMDFDGVIHAIVGVDNVSEENLKTLCGMLKHE